MISSVWPWRTARSGEISGDFQVRLSIEPSDKALFTRPDETVPGAFYGAIDPATLPPFQPVKGVFVFGEGVGTAMESLVEVAQDAVSQIGVNTTLDARHLESQYDLEFGDSS